MRPSKLLASLALLIACAACGLLSAARAEFTRAALLEEGGSHVPEGASFSHLLAVIAKSHADDAFMEHPDFKGTLVAPNDTAFEVLAQDFGFQDASEMLEADIMTPDLATEIINLHIIPHLDTTTFHGHDAEKGYIVMGTNGTQNIKLLLEEHHEGGQKEGEEHHEEEAEGDHAHEEHEEMAVTTLAPTSMTVAHDEDNHDKDSHEDGHDGHAEHGEGEHGEEEHGNEEEHDHDHKRRSSRRLLAEHEEEHGDREEEHGDHEEGHDEHEDGHKEHEDGHKEHEEHGNYFDHHGYSASISKVVNEDGKQVLYTHQALAPMSLVMHRASQEDSVYKAIAVTPCLSTLKAMLDTPELSSLKEALEATGEDAFNGTLLAPDNDAFGLMLASMHMGAHDLVHKFPAMARQMLRMHLMPYAYNVEELTTEGKGLQAHPDRMRPGHEGHEHGHEEEGHAEEEHAEGEHGEHDHEVEHAEEEHAEGEHGEHDHEEEYAEEEHAEGEHAEEEHDHEGEHDHRRLANRRLLAEHDHEGEHDHDHGEGEHSEEQHEEGHDEDEHGNHDEGHDEGVVTSSNRFFSMRPGYSIEAVGHKDGEVEIRSAGSSAKLAATDSEAVVNGRARIHVLAGVLQASKVAMDHSAEGLFGSSSITKPQGKQYGRLMSMLKEAGLENVTADLSGYTFIAPSDEAFDEFLEFRRIEDFHNLLGSGGEHKDLLTRILSTHLVKMSAEDDLVHDAVYETRGEDIVRVSIDEASGTITIVPTSGELVAPASGRRLSAHGGITIEGEATTESGQVYYSTGVLVGDSYAREINSFSIYESNGSWSTQPGITLSVILLAACLSLLGL
ncbi:hypothetical protein DUNSADRAFT_15432 [Dunaliella salina]|uniref:FAS1 domain-containing protein n=1 Tax=Dunaliella salina TaxID=3046 RepID=A0ABQ7G5E6_DUNSA|nr:hypothetical protein DUNSADRAFT_15432 [Dunaliella salina]|eukprot:KAF5829832.1 hypothetical protein DUNSADRAFT_15432 [Dunaliella salina]